MDRVAFSRHRLGDLDEVGVRVATVNRPNLPPCAQHRPRLRRFAFSMRANLRGGWSDPEISRLRNTGAVFGLSSAMNQEFTLSVGEAMQSNFHDFAATRINRSPQFEAATLGINHKMVGRRARRRGGAVQRGSCAHRQTWKAATGDARVGLRLT